MKATKTTGRTMSIITWHPDTKDGTIRVATAGKTSHYFVFADAGQVCWAEYGTPVRDAYRCTIGREPIMDRCTCAAYTSGRGRFRCKHVDATRVLMARGTV